LGSENTSDYILDTDQKKWLATIFNTTSTNNS